MRKGIISVLSILAGIAIGAEAAGKREIVKKRRAESMSDKHLAMFLMMNQWVRLKQNGRNIAEYLKEENYRNIAVYGMSYIGETLVEELKYTDIHVAYGIDNNAALSCSDPKIVSMEDKLAETDAVVVTAIASFREIQEMLSKKVHCPIISLEDIVYDI